MTDQNDVFNKRIPLSLVALLILGAPALSQAETQTAAGQVEVADVTVTGNQSISTDRIMSFVKIRAGNRYSRGALKDLQLDSDRRLIETGWFKNVVTRTKELPCGRTVVEFTVQELPNLIDDIIYKNANHISKKELAKLTLLEKGVPLNPYTNRKACFAIQNFLKHQGRYFANVILEEGADVQDHRVVFNIAEGPVVHVTQVRFVGNHSFDASCLKNLIKSYGTFFYPALVDCDVLWLEQFYKEKGYMDVRVTRELGFSKDSCSVDVVFHIDEGQRYRIENTLVEKDGKISPPEIKRFLQESVPQQ
jgi:outer membrane protein insertion porin family